MLALRCDLIWCQQCAVIMDALALRVHEFVSHQEAPARNALIEFDGWSCRGWGHWRGHDEDWRGGWSRCWRGLCRSPVPIRHRPVVFLCWHRTSSYGGGLEGYSQPS